ncbi:hypothetical protein AB0J57_33540 [Streptomyces sp. NPDC049837]|uniref:hypothetical protein n=1 Tax=Streptomyces sp. NPDC049837 TaxID=3155277 RepID=UPI00341D63B0
MAPSPSAPLAAAAQHPPEPGQAAAAQSAARTPAHPVRPVRASLGGAPSSPADRTYEAGEPVVHITIDRLEVRAAAPQAEAPARTTRRRPQLGLDEYLRGRS